MCEANKSIDGVFDSVPNLSKGLGKERVREEVEAAPKQMGEKRLTKEPH